jgi:carboxypeptidase Taq
MAEKLNQLKAYINEITDIYTAVALLGWDQQVNMPHGGSEDRGNVLATLAHIGHQKVTSPEVGQMIEAASKELEASDPDSDDARLIRVTRREFNKRNKVPARWVTENAQATTWAQTVWEEARAKSDFALFRPHLEKVVALKREYASFFSPFEHIYDPLLDDYEPGMKTAEVQTIFDVVRPQQVALIKAIADRPVINDAFLHIPYDEKAQWDFGVEVISAFGFDWNRGRQDKSVHPFTQSFGIGDVRITTRFDPERAASALFSTMHEGGHAMYEQGVSTSLRRTPLASGASMALHESQSRLWENLIGRSLPFWKFFFPHLRAKFPSQLGNVDLMTFYRGINKVEPSLVRVEADEATYNLHIMLRMELEIALLDGSLEVKDLPEAWNERMRAYLGITPPNDGLGVLQDVHWSSGMIGYFPTYALGNLVSAQLWDGMCKEIPDLYEQFERGEYLKLLDWMHEKIHRHGAKFEPQELIQKATGSRIDPKPYLHYLVNKYSEIYHL